MCLYTCYINTSLKKVLLACFFDTEYIYKEWASHPISLHRMWRFLWHFFAVGNCMYIHSDLPFFQKKIICPCLEEIKRFFCLRYRCEKLSFFERTSNVCNHKAFHFILCVPHQLPRPPKQSAWIFFCRVVGGKLFIPRKADIKMQMLLQCSWLKKE